MACYGIFWSGQLYFLLFWGMVIYDNEFETKEIEI